MSNRIAQQPIIALDGSIYGYELLYRGAGTGNTYNGMDGETSTATVLSNAFMSLGDDLLAPGQRAFINYTGMCLLSRIPALLNPQNTVVEVLESTVDSNEILRSVANLKGMGHLIALDDYEYKENNSQLFNLCDIVKMDFRVSSVESLLGLATLCKRNNKVMLAEKVENEEEFIFAKKIGCTLFQGYYFQKPTVRTRNVGRPQAHILMRLFMLLFNDNLRMNAVVDAINSDAVLQLRLVSLVGNIYPDMRNISSVEMLVSRLGLPRLRNWVYLIGLHCFGDSNEDHAIQLSTGRAKFCRYLADACPLYRGDPGSAYLVGSLSLLLHHADFAKPDFTKASLSADIQAALVANKGILAEFLKIALGFESGNQKEYQSAIHRAEKLQIPTHALDMHYRQCVASSQSNALESLMYLNNGIRQ